MTGWYSTHSQYLNPYTSSKHVHRHFHSYSYCGISSSDWFGPSECLTSLYNPHTHTLLKIHCFAKLSSAQAQKYDFSISQSRERNYWFIANISNTINFLTKLQVDNLKQQSTLHCSSSACGIKSILVSSRMDLRSVRAGFIFLLGTEGFSTVNFSHLQCFQYSHFPSTWGSAAPQSSEICGCIPCPTFSSKFLLEEELQKDNYYILLQNIFIVSSNLTASHP